jgi:PAS domain S-box-containing protein
VISTRWANSAQRFLKRRAATLVAALFVANVLGNLWLYWTAPVEGAPPHFVATLVLSTGLTALFSGLLALVILALRREAAVLTGRVERRTHELIDANEKYRQLFERAHNGLLILAAGGRIVEGNHAACELLGYSQDQLLALHASQLFDAQSHARFTRQLDEALGEERSFGGAFSVRREAGQSFEVELQAASFDFRGSPHLLVELQDTSEQKYHEQAREEALRAAQAANLAKTEFLANMSHEIRTPMTAILGYAEYLGDTGHPEEQQKEWAATIRRNGQHLLTIINDILDLSKIEAGRMTIEEVDYSPAQLLTDVAAMMRVRAQKQGIEFELEFDGSLPGTVRTDPTRLRQILINLIGNAVKFTAEGEVRVRARLLTRAMAEPLLQIDIQDTGIGMETDQLEAIFEPFAQADPSVARRFAGTGLGLTISRHLAKMLGGDIEARSRPGRGSLFRLTIRTGPLGPLVSTDGTPTPGRREKTPGTAMGRLSAGASKPLAGASILLAEDGVDNQRLISMVLQNAGAAVDIAENGQVALSMAFPDGTRTSGIEATASYDLILMDMQMPELDGYSATETLRTLGYAGPILALTAHAMESDRQRCIEAGCDDHIAKPVRRDVLIQAILDHLEQKSRV